MLWRFAMYARRTLRALLDQKAATGHTSIGVTPSLLVQGYRNISYKPLASDDGKHERPMGKVVR